MRVDRDDHPVAPAVPGPPQGWYPDPSGTFAWRRWEGSAWGAETMPFAPPAPDRRLLASEQAAWQQCRRFMPWALALQAVSAVALAAESPSLSALRRYLRVAYDAGMRGERAPTAPADIVPVSSTALALTHWAIIIVTLFGLATWIRFSTTSLRVTGAAGYPRRRSAAAVAVTTFIPVAGPIVAYVAGRDSLPDGHEARAVLADGWGLVAIGQLLAIALACIVLSTGATTPTWVVATLCAAAWVLAALELPVGLEAIAVDHASLDDRPARPRS